MSRVNWDFLNKCTKEELIFFIKQNGFFTQRFRYSDVLSRRWQIKSDAVLKKQKEHTEKLNNIDMSKRDELAKQFNSETDAIKRIDILKKMKPYEDSFKRWMNEDKKIQKEQEEVDKLYEELSAEYDRNRE